MLAHDRLNVMLDYLKMHRSASYTRLANELHTSPSTARRDAEELVRQGYLEKVYGGVILNKASINTLPLPARLNSNRDKKDIVAEKAAQMLHSDMSLFLYSGSTTLRLVPYLSRFTGLKVLTNSMMVCEELARMEIPCFCTGGRLRVTDRVFVGPYAEKTLEGFHADASFFAPSGLSVEGDITLYREESMSFIRLMMKRSDAFYLLCDSSKLNHSEFYSVGSVEEVDAVFCDEPLPPDLSARVGLKRNK